MDKFVLLKRIKEAKQALEELENVIECDCEKNERVYRSVRGSKAYIDRTKHYVRDRFRMIESHMRYESYSHMVYKERRATALDKEAKR